MKPFEKTDIKKTEFFLSGERIEQFYLNEFKVPCLKYYQDLLINRCDISKELFLKEALEIYGISFIDRISASDCATIYFHTKDSMNQFILKYL